MSNTKELQIVERNEFNHQGILQVKYFVYYGERVISLTDSLKEAEDVYYNILNRKSEPSRIVLKQALVSDSNNQII